MVASSSTMGITICVIDVRLGKQEHDAEEQLLGSWSSRRDISAPAAMDVVRLGRGSLGLCSHFSETGVCSCVTFGKHTMVIEEAEPSLVWIIYAPSSYLSFPISSCRTRDCLHSINNLFRFMYRPLSSVIQSQGYLAAREALKDFLNVFMPGFCKQEGWCTLHDCYTPMTPHRGLPFIPLKDPLFQGIQALATSLTATNSVLGRPTLGCMVTYKHALLHSTMSTKDTTALYLFASRNVIPVTRTENQTTRTFQKLYSGVKDWRKPPGAILDPSTWSVATASEHQGLLLCEQCGMQMEQGPSTIPSGFPAVYLHEGTPARLVVWQRQGLLVMVVTAGEQPLYVSEFELVRSQFVKMLSEVERQLSPLLPSPRQGFISTISSEVKSHEKGHIRGHRYTLTDGASETPICAGTPLPKLVAATSQTGQAAISMVWEDCQNQMNADKYRSGSSTSDVGPSCPSAEDVAGTSRNVPEKGHKGEEYEGTSAEDAETNVMPRMDLLAQAPNRRWIQCRWALNSEFLYIDDATAKDSPSLANFDQASKSMVATYFPGILGI